MRSGWIDIKTERIMNANFDGLVWSKTAAGYANVINAMTYYPAIIGNEFDPSFGPGSRRYGLPLRYLV